MSKKTIRKSFKKTAAKKVAAKSSVSRKKAAAKGSAKKTTKPAKKTVVARAGGKGVKAVVAKRSQPQPTAKATPTASAPAPKPDVSLGRPLVTQEEKLYMLFHDDFQARQVFEFLRVHTVKELEQFSQPQIVYLMSKPLRMTVDRIRQRLAQFKRSLRDDEQFAAEYRKQAD